MHFSPYQTSHTVAAFPVQCCPLLYCMTVSMSVIQLNFFFYSYCCTGCFFSVGNKSDRTDREITQELGRQFAQENDMPFLETSAKNSNNIDELFMQLAKTLRESHVDKRPRSHGGGATSGGRQPNTVTLTQKTSSEQASGGGGGCCWFVLDFISCTLMIMYMYVYVSWPI